MTRMAIQANRRRGVRRHGFLGKGVSGSSRLVKSKERINVRSRVIKKAKGSRTGRHVSHKKDLILII